jgi:hypothetical protein
VLLANLHSIVIMDKHITKCLLGQDYDYNASLRVVGVALRMQKAHLQKVAKLGKIKGKPVEKPRIRDTICDLFHIGHDAYSQIVGGYLHNRKVYVSGKNKAGRAGNCTPKATHIPCSKMMQIAVRDFVCGHRMSRQRVTARQMLDFLVEQKHLVVPIDREGRYQTGEFKVAYRNVQRWLKEFGGYERGKRKGNLVPSEANVAKKHHYLRTFFANRAKAQGRD